MSKTLLQRLPRWFWIIEEELDDEDDDEDDDDSDEDDSGYPGARERFTELREQYLKTREVIEKNVLMLTLARKSMH